jgi:hypothetical protein
VRVHIISELEGVAEIVEWGQAGGGEPLSEAWRQSF